MPKSSTKRKHEEYFEAERIADEKKIGSELFYLVKWKGLDSSGQPWKPTWEPAKHCTKLLVTDWERYKKRKPLANGRISESTRASRASHPPLSLVQASTDRMPQVADVENNKTPKRGKKFSHNTLDYPSEQEVRPAGRRLRPLGMRRLSSNSREYPASPRPGSPQNVIATDTSQHNRNDTDTSSCGDYDEEVLCDSNSIAKFFPESNSSPSMVTDSGADESNLPIENVDTPIAESTNMDTPEDIKKVIELGSDDETPETVVDEPSGSTADTRTDELDETINPVPSDNASEEIRLKSNIQELQDLLEKKDDRLEKAESNIRELTRKLKRAELDMQELRCEKYLLQDEVDSLKQTTQLLQDQNRAFDDVRRYLWACQASKSHKTDTGESDATSLQLQPNGNVDNAFAEAFMCEWENCGKAYESKRELKAHLFADHLYVGIVYIDRPSVLK
ncbi:6428_t:CDS:2 [Paraglomus occultum]|uniref:6428_t:CDS:1 n=1 Tax=Paraglomus occultum TaxID=144539 RepID=A0A9N9CBQ2_9GLOM|nr:6428_t:CDS:2 [Paraglomus occultum]